MRRKHSLLLSALLGLGVAMPTAIAAQTADSAPQLEVRHGQRMAGPAERLLRHRSELQLTEQQVKGLETIRTRYQEKNRPLIEQVHGAEVSSAMSQLRANREAARNEALAILSAQQRQRVEQHQGHRRAEGKRRGHCPGRQHRT
ncbi:MAG: hypothetical protein H0T44_03000 [Gemmatimonadales bacterium]|nr:hypothetical protein [Gemmatimonadales bacterium]MDQ3426586.1 hypothetical protein [Gemmatimonadota bacterium]